MKVNIVTKKMYDTINISLKNGVIIRFYFWPLRVWIWDLWEFSASDRCMITPWISIYIREWPSA